MPGKDPDVDYINKYWAERGEAENDKDFKKITTDNETKEQKFRRLMSVRATKLLKQINAIKALSNSNIYEYNEEQVAQVKEQITEAMEVAFASFSGKTSKEGPQVNL